MRGATRGIATDDCRSRHDPSRGELTGPVMGYHPLKRLQYAAHADRLRP
jgi:hypothetical protein